jgi:hypothetical protein
VNPFLARFFWALFWALLARFFACFWRTGPVLARAGAPDNERRIVIKRAPGSAE